MKANVELVSESEIQNTWVDREGSRVWRVLDYSLFMYGLVRGDIFVSHTEGVPVYSGLGVWELGGVHRLGLPVFERNTVLTSLSGLVTASKVEFTVDPADRYQLGNLGFVIAVVETALYFSRRTPFHLQS